MSLSVLLWLAVLLILLPDDFRVTVYILRRKQELAPLFVAVGEIMTDYMIRNKTAWEYNAYDFWMKEAGLPADRAKKSLTDPRRVYSHRH